MADTDRLAQAAENASNVLAEIYAKYSTKIGPFATQAQKANGELRAALASLAPAAVEGAPVAWHESETPPNCPSIKGDEPVRLEWWNAQGLRCTAWRSAQEIGAAFDTAAQVAAQCEGLRKDAGRYKWLKAEDEKSRPYDFHSARNNAAKATISWRDPTGQWAALHPHKDNLDALIDSAIAAGNGEGV